MSDFWAFLNLGFACSCFFIGAIMLVRLKCHEAALRRLSVSKTSKTPKELQVVALHPDLGLGGAERLVIDAALALESHQSHVAAKVLIVTSRHDPARAFAETRDGRVRVRVTGAWLPASILGKARVLCAALRMSWAALAMCYTSPATDCYIVDQVALVLPVLYFLAPNTPRLFYCHFPDKCCDPNRDETGTFVRPVTRLHTIYRRWFDSLESWSMGFADSIVSNSKFSRDITVKTFPQLEQIINPDTDIFYPPVSWGNKIKNENSETNLANNNNNNNNNNKEEEDQEIISLRKLTEGKIVLLSINRYERKKNLPLAIEAFSHVIKNTSKKVLLIMAGGYDASLKENVEHLQELKELTIFYNLTEDQVIFLQNISNNIKNYLLSNCCCLIYTPTMEHFGIVPTEAMVCGKPVVAVNKGGPCESVGEGGTLCEPTALAFAEAITSYVEDEKLAARVGAAGQKRALSLFCMNVFGEKLATRLLKLWEEKNIELAVSQEGKSSKDSTIDIDKNKEKEDDKKEN